MTSKAETIARNLAERFEAAGLSHVTVTVTETPAVMFTEAAGGGIMLDGTVSAMVIAHNRFGGYYSASWQTRTTGRRTTRFLCGTRYYGPSTPDRRLTAKSAPFYAECFEAV